MKAPAEERGESARRAAPAPPPRTAVDPEPSTTEVRGTCPRPLSPAVAQRLQSVAGNRAVAALVAQRRAAAPRTPAARSGAGTAARRPGSGGAARGPAVPAQRAAGPASSGAVPTSASAAAPGIAGPAEAAPVQRLATDAGPVHRPGPQADPKFAALKADVRGKQQSLSAHPPAQAEAARAQGAAKPPQDDKEAQGKAANAEKMNAAKPGEFDKAAFVRAVNEAIAAQAPKNLDEADKFGDSGKADAVKGQVQGQVTDGKKASANAIETTTKAPPDTSKAVDKQVTPLVADRPPGTPGTPDPAKAVPDKAPPAATDFSDGPKQVDQQMADAQVTEEQLAKSNEPEFTGALKEKDAAEQHAATAPGQVRAAEAQTLAGAKAAAGQEGAAAMAALATDRKQAGAQVGAGKEEAKSADEAKRAKVTAVLQKVFDATKKDVEEILSGLDKKVDDKFSAGEKAARDAFTAEHKRRMDEYKDKRYSGIIGKGRWIKDKFAGLPEEANQIFVVARKGYVDRMQQVISGVADVIGAELTRAKQRIAAGRNELQAEVRKLPADLQAIGKEAAGEFAGKFDELTESVNSKGTELVQTLASKYNEALKSVDEEIAAEKEKNKGLVAKAVDAVAGVIKTIMQLKDMLMGVLAKAAQAVMAIIKDPIGFLGNLASAVGAGLRQFMGNLPEHLKKGLVGWLTGAMAGAGLELPAKFDLRGIVLMIGSLLGLTWASIRGRIVQRGVPEQAMSAVESSVPLVQKVQAQGLGGMWEEIQDKVGDLKANLFSKISEYLIPTVLMAGITWIISLLNPASAFVRAVKMIIDFVTFIVTQGAQIIEFVNSVLDAIIAIAGGGTGGVPALIEKALARSVPVLIGVLAAVLGIGGIAQKVQKFFKALSKPVMKAVDWVVGKIVGLGKKLWAKLRAGSKAKKKPEPADKTGKVTSEELAREVRESLGPAPSPDKVGSVADAAYARHRPRGLKALHFTQNPKRPGEFDVLMKASPLRRVQVFRISDLQLNFPRTACIVHVTTPDGKEENLGKFLAARRRPGVSKDDSSNHAEQVMIRILRSSYFSGDRPAGRYSLQLSLTRRPCQACGPALQDFKDELKPKGFDVSFSIRMVSAYSGEGEDIMISVLKALREKGFALEALSLQKIIAENLLGDPAAGLSEQDKERLESCLQEVKAALDKAEVKKGS
ncbi:hypothetical protein [Micromonospora sp. NPDC048830]|uniref:hypothetical protein n=1 Tax=Micromonospora sp. NPDC048830 TaxID=3364257 RepID=UPI003716D003